MEHHVLRHGLGKALNLRRSAPSLGELPIVETTLIGASDDPVILTAALSCHARASDAVRAAQLHRAPLSVDVLELGVVMGLTSAHRCSWAIVAFAASCGSEPTRTAVVDLPMSFQPSASSSAAPNASLIRGEAACLVAFRSLDLRRGYPNYAGNDRTLDEARTRGADLARVAKGWASVRSTIAPGRELDAASALGVLIDTRARLLSDSPPNASPPPPAVTRPPLSPNATPAQIAKRAAMEEAAEFGMQGLLSGQRLFEKPVEDALAENDAALRKAALAFLDVCLDRIDFDKL